MTKDNMTENSESPAVSLRKKLDDAEHQITTLKARLDEAETANKKYAEQIDRIAATEHLAVAAAAAGVLPGAIPDAVGRALRSGAWKIDSKGELVRHSDDYPEIDANGDKITPESIMKSFRQEAAFYWPQGEAEAPAEAPVSSSKPAAVGGRGWMDMNLTEQSQLFRRDPQQALALATAAGVPLTPGLRVGEMPK